MSILGRFIAPNPGLFERFRSWLHLLTKYSLSSLSATGVDFLAFHLALTLFLLTAVQSTVVGRCAGACVAFGLQRRWVFQCWHATNRLALVVKYGSGVLLGMGLNVGAVWLLHNIAGWAPWPARITAATTGWFLIFQFNHRVVFRSKAADPAPVQRPFKIRT